MDAENNNTPRTEANLHDEFPHLINADFARQLEREINELRQQVAHLKSNVSPVDYKRAFEYLEREMALMIDKAPEYVGVLRRENERLTSERDALKIEYECRAEWISKMVKILGCENKDGFNCKDAHWTAEELVRQNERMMASINESKKNNF